VKLLLGRKEVNPDLKDDSNQTPLSRATRHGYEWVRKLLQDRLDAESDM